MFFLLTSYTAIDSSKSFSKCVLKNNNNENCVIGK